MSGFVTFLVGVLSSIAAAAALWVFGRLLVLLNEQSRDRREFRLTGKWYAWWQPRDRSGTEWYRDVMNVRRSRWNARRVVFRNQRGATYPSDDGSVWDWQCEGTVSGRRHIVGSWKSYLAPHTGAFVVTFFQNGLIGYLVGDNPELEVKDSPFILLRYHDDKAPPSKEEATKILDAAMRTWPSFDELPKL